MNSPFKMAPGRGPMQKTGRGIPKSMCSPAMQKDAISGKKLTGKEDFGNTTKSTDSEGYTTYTTPYSTKGTPGTADQMPDADWTKLVAERKAKGKGPINPPGSKGSVTKGTLGTKGTVERKTFQAPMAGIKPVPYKNDTPEIVGKRAKRTLTPPTSTPPSKKTTTIGKIKKGAEKLGNYLTPDSPKGKKDYCKISGGGLSQ